MVAEPEPKPFELATTGKSLFERELQLLVENYDKLTQKENNDFKEKAEILL